MRLIYLLWCLLVIIILAPISIPAILLGSICRVVHSGFLYGYETLDDLLRILVVKAFTKENKNENINNS